MAVCQRFQGLQILTIPVSDGIVKENKIYPISGYTGRRQYEHQRSNFDLDGTLLDSTEIWEGVAARYITSLRKNPEPDLRKKTKAMTLPVLCSYLKDEYRIATTESKIAKGSTPSCGRIIWRAPTSRSMYRSCWKNSSRKALPCVLPRPQTKHRRRDPGTSGDP